MHSLTTNYYVVRLWSMGWFVMTRGAEKRNAASPLCPIRVNRIIEVQVEGSVPMQNRATERLPTLVLRKRSVVCENGHRHRGKSGIRRKRTPPSPRKERDSKNKTTKGTWFLHKFYTWYCISIFWKRSAFLFSAPNFQYLAQAKLPSPDCPRLQRALIDNFAKSRTDIKIPRKLGLPLSDAGATVRPFTDIKFDRRVSIFRTPPKKYHN